MTESLPYDCWYDSITINTHSYSVELHFNQHGLNWLEMTLLVGEVNLTGSPPEGFGRVHQWLLSYFNGECPPVDFPIDWLQFTPFQRKALEVVAAIPYGKVLTYTDVARSIQKPTAVRAVAHANATNPMPIVIPCHRVIGSDRRLHGYSGPGGLEFKAYLLKLEGQSIVDQRVV